MTRPRAKSIIVFCHRPDHYLRKQFVRFGNGRRKVEYVLEPTGTVVREKFALGACPNSHCSILNESDSTLGHEQVFSPLEYRSDAASAAECAGLRAERPCLAVYR